MTAAGNAKHQAAMAHTATEVAVLRADIHDQLTQLVKHDGYLAALASTRQSVSAGYVSDDVAKIRDRQIRGDRAAARGAGRVDTLGMGWVNATEIGDASGPVPAPVTISAVSVSAEIVFALQFYVRRLTRVVAGDKARVTVSTVALRARTRLAAEEQLRGWCTWPPTDTEAVTRNPAATTGDTPDLARQLGRLVDACEHRPTLTELLDKIDQLGEQARDVIDGPAKTNHAEPCPWCGRKSLVEHHRIDGRDTQLIRCEGRHRCECDWEWCDCHRNPIRNRHEWVNSGRAAHTWTELQNLQTKRKELTMMETKALDALEQIRALHQPFWVDADGDAHPHYVLVAGEDLEKYAPGHECITAGPDACVDVDDPDSAQHSVPGCVECQATAPDTDTAGYRLWPCATHQLTDLEAQP